MQIDVGCWAIISMIVESKPRRSAVPSEMQVLPSQVQWFLLTMLLCLPCAVHVLLSAVRSLMSVIWWEVGYSEGVMVLLVRSLALNSFEVQLWRPDRSAGTVPGKCGNLECCAVVVLLQHWASRCLSLCWAVFPMLCSRCCGDSS